MVVYHITWKQNFGIPLLQQSTIRRPSSVKTCDSTQHSLSK